MGGDGAEDENGKRLSIQGYGYLSFKSIGGQNGYSASYLCHGTVCDICFFTYLSAFLKPSTMRLLLEESN